MRSATWDAALQRGGFLRGWSNEAVYASTKAAQVVMAGALDKELRSTTQIASATSWAWSICWRSASLTARPAPSANSVAIAAGQIVVTRIPSDCDGVGIEYIGLSTGTTAGAVFTWNKPWDHVAGLLAVVAAGGSQTANGTGPFTPHGPNPLPLVVGTPDVVASLLNVVRRVPTVALLEPPQRPTGA